MNIGEKVAYLQGLAEGIEISADKKEGKLLKGMLDILGDIAESLKNLAKEQEELSIYAEELDEDLGVLEKIFIKNGAFELDDDLSGLDLYEQDEDYEDFGDLEGSAKVNCPECGELILFDVDDIEQNGSVDCPECGAEISVVGEFSSEERGGCGGCRAHLHAEQEDA
jgi:endogenous inhibitor of DNA gyrase (YacG/DUF329 family)